MAKEITREELKESLRHYWRMRAWAKKQRPEGGRVRAKMSGAIEEVWDGRFCVLCKKYGAEDCILCPLHIAGVNCNYFNSIWAIMNQALSWSEWITAATNMARTIMKLPRQK